jgi:hypothetical protein
LVGLMPLIGTAALFLFGQEYRRNALLASARTE